MPRLSSCLAGLLAATLLLPTLGCEPVSDRYPLVVQDFEALPPGTDNPVGVVAREQAHGGLQALAVGAPGHEFGNLLNQSWGQLGRPHRLRWRAWVWLPHGRARSAFVETKVLRGTTAVHQQRQALAEVVCRYGQWVLTTSTIRLPRSLQPDNTVMVYLWVPSAQNTVIYVDNFSLESLD